MKIIDLRSDTVTLPTEEMMEAIRAAKLGDDVFGDDPTVIELKKKQQKCLEKRLLCLSAQAQWEICAE